MVIPKGKVKVTGAETNRKKYFSSWIVPLLGTFIVLLATSSIFLRVLFIMILLVLGFFFARLSILRYDTDFMYLGNRKVSFDTLISISSFEINNENIITLKCKEGDRVKRYYVAPGSLSIVYVVFEALGFGGSLKRLKGFIEYANYRIAENKKRRS